MLLAGLVLARSAMMRFEHVTWFPCYEAWMRGGSCICMVVISERPVGSPLVMHPTTLIALDGPSLLHGESKVKPGGLIIYDSSLVSKSIQREDVRSHDIEATKMALALGARQVTNLILLGAYLSLVDLVPLSDVEEVLRAILREEGKEAFYELNVRALKLGWQTA